MTTASTWAEDPPPCRSGQDLRTRPDPVRTLAVDTVLINGGLMYLRPVRPEDEAALLELHEHLSERSFYLRFFTVSPAAAPWFVHRVVRTPAADHAALVAEVDGQVVGLAAYERLDDPRDADLSIAVDDRQQGRGIGTLLLEHLVAKARAHGMQRFVGQILSDNVQMSEVFGDLGLAVHRALRNGVVEVELALDDERYRAAIEEREARATVRSLVPLLHPRSVAVVGAGRTPRTGWVTRCSSVCSRRGHRGCLPGEPQRVTVASRPAYASLADLPGPVDLAVVAVPAAAVPDTVRACGDCGVRAVVVLAAGFADAGERGVGAQSALVTRARAAGMCLLGPNCLGVGNTAPNVRLNLGSAAEAVRAYREMAGRLAGQMTGAVVQPMVPAGVEVVVGVVHDPAFGPLVMFGLGGVTTDLLADHAFRALPLTDVDAADLVRSVRAASLLFGYRGAPAVDIAAIEDLVLRVACLADELPELAELDLNPIMATCQGAIAVDIAVRLAPPPATYDPYLRQLD